MTRFVDVYNPETGIKQSVPEHFLGDPVLGRNLRKTPQQQALDGELGQAPTADSTIDDIRQFAGDAEIDLTGLSLKGDLLERVQSVVGHDPLPEPTTAGEQGLVDVETGGDPDLPAGETPDGEDPINPDGTEPTDETPATGDEEN